MAVVAQRAIEVRAAVAGTEMAGKVGRVLHAGELGMDIHAIIVVETTRTDIAMTALFNAPAVRFGVILPAVPIIRAILVCEAAA